jgi:hypothetical protein
VVTKRVTSRAWQRLAAVVAIGALVVGLVIYGLRDDEAAAPTRSGPPQSHAGAQHHTAEKHVGTTLSPLQLFAGSVVGEWHAYESFTEQTDAPPRKTMTTMLIVDAVDDKHVTITKHERPDSLTPPTKTTDQRPRQGLTIDALAGNQKQQWTLYGLTITDDVRDVGRAFKCKKLVFSLVDPTDRKKQATAELWISDEVPAGGLVELRQSFAGMPFGVNLRLIGFGTATATTWGKKPEDLP